jgi:type I restriction enzyme R subunit
VAYASPMLSRQERATQAKIGYSAQINYRQQAFIDFVLSHYVAVGVEELSRDKLTPLLRLKYRDSIADAMSDLGRPEEIGRFFAGFQRHLYDKAPAPA